MKCVEIDGSGFVVESLDIPPNCTEFALVTASELTAQTYWADLAIELDPGNANNAFYTLAGSMILAYASVAAVRLIVNNLKIENRI